MPRNVIQVDPDKFPWLDLRRYTFSLGTEKDGVAYVSGHTASTYDKEQRRVRCAGDIVEQSKVAWEKIGVILEAAGMTYDNIVRTVDYIAPPGLAKFRHTGAVREEYMGKSPVASTGVLVHSLLRPDALIEINVIAAKGKKEAVIPPGPEFERFKQLTYAPAVKVDNKVWLTGVITLEPNDTVAQAEWCYDRMETILTAAGASFGDVINTMNYVDPQATVTYPEVTKLREQRFGGVYPASSSVHFHRMLSPHGHLEIEATAVLGGGREEIVPSGWEQSWREMTAAPAVKKGNLLYISGQASVDHKTGESLVYKYDLAEQARQAYRNVAEICAEAGVGLDDIMYTLECTPPTVQNDIRGLAAVRRDVFGDDFPAATGLMIHQNGRPEQVFQVVAVAVV